jgi:hypothetical protein
MPKVDEEDTKHITDGGLKEEGPEKYQGDRQSQGIHVRLCTLVDDEQKQPSFPKSAKLHCPLPRKDKGNQSHRLSIPHALQNCRRCER